MAAHEVAAKAVATEAVAVEIAVASVEVVAMEDLVVAEMVVAIEVVAAMVEDTAVAVEMAADPEVAAVAMVAASVETVAVAVVAVVAEAVRVSLVSNRVLSSSKVKERFMGMPSSIIGGNFPQPNADVTKLEDKLAKELKVEAVTHQLGSMNISSEALTSVPLKHFPVRPAYGSKGKAIVVATNYYEMTIKPQTLIQYKLTPTRFYPPGTKAPAKKTDPKGRKLHRIIQLAMEKVGGSWVSEFKDYVYSLNPLVFPDDPDGNSTVRIEYTDEGRPMEFDVKFDQTKSIDVAPLVQYLTTMKNYSGDFPVHADVVSAIGAVLGHTPRSNNNVASLGSSRHFPLNVPGQSSPLGRPDMNTIIRGYFQSVRPATGRLLLNLNVSHGVFRFAGPVKGLLEQYDDYNLRYVHRLLARLRAEVVFLFDHGQPKSGKKGKVAGPPQDKTGRRTSEKTLTGMAMRFGGPKSVTVQRDFARPHEVSFVLDGNGEVPSGFQAGQSYTVAQYYKIRYNYTVEPNLPVIHVGSKDKPIYIPAEFVTIKAGQAVRRKTTPEETREMIEFACRSPFANATSISSLGRQSLGLDDSEVLKAFNVTVGKNLLTVHARELPTPSIQYQGQKMASVFEGGWNMQGIKVYRPGQPIERCTWVNIHEDGNGRPYDPNVLISTMEAWRKFMNDSMGILSKPFKHPNGLQIQLSRGQHAEPVLREAFKTIEAAQMVFVVLPGKGAEHYNAVKLLGDSEFGFHTVCVVRDSLLKGLAKDPRQYYANVGLKVNLKMGGANHKLREDIPIFKEGKTMSVGYDVTHPTNNAGGGDGLPSIVGMVSSTDRDLAQWLPTTWTQKGRQEMLDDRLTDEFVGRIRLWQKANKGQLPDNILIFRDGVSEGQFAQVLTNEVPQMRRACAKIYPANRKPLFTLVVSVKRHQTRFYPTASTNMTRSRNVKNGTVVDRGVTLARTWDFFLVAHNALQGTARPAHYTVLLDEIFEPKYKAEAANMMEKVVHEMCYLFGRATKAVSICPPAYYADILCTRRRVYMSDVFDASTDDNTSVSSGAQNKIENASGRKIHDRLKDTMYYI
ncbi:piwi domain-containing protein [Apiospora saccharicola]|uniref:Piwi domain-containing protein n=1 Tax=Apiospora saccharicola TaxID=335842 RepID=A0ABR1U411_9PEZI